MNFELIPILGPTMDWDRFVLKTKELTGVSPARQVDALGYEPKPPARILLLLESFKNSNLGLVDSIAQAQKSLEHLFIGFMLQAPQKVINRFVLASTVSCLPSECEELILVSGTMDQWKVTLAECYKDKLLEPIGLSLYNFFKSLGLQTLWQQSSSGQASFSYQLK